MSNCCGNKNIKGGIKPNLSCVPDTSTLLLRFIDRKSLGIVKGANELFSFDLSSFFLPISNYSKQTICLNKGDLKLIDTGVSKDLGERRQIISFNLNQYFDYVNNYKLSFYDEFGDIIGTELTGEFTDIDDLENSIKIKISNDSEIKNKLELLKVEDEHIYFRYKIHGKSFSADFTIHDSNYYQLIEFEPIIEQTALRYPQGAYKFVFLFVEFCQDCGIASNEQKIYWSKFNDNNFKWTPSGPILFLTGAEDLEESDMNKIESFWIKNEGDCEVKINIITGI